MEGRDRHRRPQGPACQRQRWPLLSRSTMLPVEPISWAILLATVPGYLTIFFATRNSTWRGLTGDLQTILQSLDLSVLMQPLLAPATLAWIYPVRDDLIHYPFESRFCSRWCSSFSPSAWA